MRDIPLKTQSFRRSGVRAKLPLTCRSTKATFHQDQCNLGEQVISYFKAQWPDNPVPKGAPQWIYYEVVVARDVVSCIVEQFVDGSLVRNSIELAQREGPDHRQPEHRSLVHGSFLEFTREHLTPIPLDEFGLLWNRAIDKPWPPERDEL